MPKSVPTTTQVGLLDLDWCHRVIGRDGEGDARVAVLTRIVEAMLAVRRLQTHRALHLEPAAPLHNLLEEHVLAELDFEGGAVERDVLTFSHNVLFDYALERVLLRGSAERLVGAIRAQPDLRSSPDRASTSTSATFGSLDATAIASGPPASPWSRLRESLRSGA